LPKTLILGGFLEVSLTIVVLIIACGVLALATAAVYAKKVMAIGIEGSAKEVVKFTEISSAIEEGAMAFLSSEYKYVAMYCVAFAAVMLFALDDAATPELNEGFFSAGAFLFGAVISSVCAFLGMKVATKGNVRTTVRARKGLAEGFSAAFNTGAVMGFALCGLAVLGLMVICLFYKTLSDNPLVVMEMVAGFGLGGSTVALFGRVGGGIYTKAADVGARR
jgi:K(+)-stimulated pyrophosphate-energized sodium pump